MATPIVLHLCWLPESYQVDLYLSTGHRCILDIHMQCMRTCLCTGSVERIGSLLECVPPGGLLRRRAERGVGTTHSVHCQ